MHEGPAKNRWQFRIQDIILLTLIVSLEVASATQKSIIYFCCFITATIIALGANKNRVFRIALLITIIGVWLLALALEHL